MSGEPGRSVSRGELLRKIIHVVVSIVAVAVVWLLPPLTGRVILAAAVAVALATEVLRRTVHAVQHTFLGSFGALLRPHEARGLTGASTLALGFLAVSIIFEPRFAGAGILYAGVGDAASALVGTAWGRIRYPTGKTLEGSIAFLLAAFAAGWVAPGIGTLPAAAAALASTVFEALPSRIDDNLALPIVGAAASWAAVVLLG